MDENWVDISYSVTAAKLKGCKLMKNISTGETKLVGEKPEPKHEEAAHKKPAAKK